MSDNLRRVEDVVIGFTPEETPRETNIWNVTELFQMENSSFGYCTLEVWKVLEKQDSSGRSPPDYPERIRRVEFHISNLIY